MKDPFQILFVCLGNICRSPAGENIFRQLVSEAGLQEKITCDSAGTIGYHSGKAPDARMSKTIKKRGYKVTGSSRQFSPRDFEIFDLILTMDDENYANILKLSKSEEERAKVRKFTDFCTKHDHHEVPDPYYGGGAGFELVTDLIEDGSAELLAQTLKSIDA